MTTASQRQPHLPAIATSLLSPQQKAAVIISLLGKEAAKPVLDHLEEGELRVFGQTMATLGDIDDDTIHAIVSEFMAAVNKSQALMRGSLQQALELLAGNISDSTLNRLRFELDQDNTASVWQSIAGVEVEPLVECLAKEHPQIAAIVLAKLPPEKAAAIFNLLAPEFSQDVISAFNQSGRPEQAFIDDVGRSIAEKFVLQSSDAGPVEKPAGQVSKMLDFVSGSVRESLLAHLEAADPAFARDVRSKMFTFNDIPSRIDNRDIAKIARAVDQGTLLKALAGASTNAPLVPPKFLENISSRLADQLKEAMAELGAVKLQDSESAQTEIIKAIRALEESGELQLIVLDEV